METSQLTCMIDCDPVLTKRVIGVFPADRLPLELPKTPFGFIANTDIHSKHGQHWCGFFCDGFGHVDFLDTYGRTPGQNSSYFQHWLRIKASKVHTNRIQLQSDHSNVCGLYCILFLRQRLLGYTYQTFLNMFDVSAVDCNDTFIADTMFNAYPLCLVNEWNNHNQICASLLPCL